MAKRRRRRNREVHPVWIALFLIVASVIWSKHLPAWELISGAILAGIMLGLIIGYRHGRKRRAVVTRSPRTAAEPKPAKPPKLPTTKQAQRNGWLPPEKPQLIGISPECADDQCAICPGEGCACSCDHDAKKIVARNAAQYDLDADGNEIPPF
jgi:hypothetical protein